MTGKLSNNCFALPPGVNWTPVDEALARLKVTMQPVVGTETVAPGAAIGRILATAPKAVRANPPFANAAVDGYGFGAGGLAGALSLPLVEGRAAAGAPFTDAVPPGHAIRILTGAEIPAGVDTVVLQEDVSIEGRRLHIPDGWKPGANTRPAGEDVAAGSSLLTPGQTIRPQDLALLTAAGVTGIEVFRPLRVAILSTGDELTREGTAATASKIHDANRPMLRALIERWGMTPVDLGQASDSAADVAQRLDRGAQEADAILTTGGASAGDEDHISRALRDAGALTVWRIAVKPGRPLALGLWQGTPVFGLPGNPVAAFTCALIFARPALFSLAGGGWREPLALTLPAAFTKSKKAGRREYLRARPGADGVETFVSEGSGLISGLAWADGLVELPDPAMTIARGDPVRYLPFAGFGL